MSAPEPRITERKRLLLARADLERMRMRLAGREARALLSPSARARQDAGNKSKARTLLAVAVPLLGAARFGRVLHIASMALGVLRVARSLRR